MSAQDARPVPPLRHQGETEEAYAHRCALALMADLRPLYMLATPTLERIMQLTIGAAHGHRDNAIVASVEQLRRSVDATLRRRARLDAEAGGSNDQAPAPEPPAPPATPGPQGGTRVPVGPPKPPTLPPARVTPWPLATQPRALALDLL